MVRFIPTVGQTSRQPGRLTTLGIYSDHQSRTRRWGGGRGAGDEPSVPDLGSGEGIQTSDGSHWRSPFCPSVLGFCRLTLHRLQGSKPGQDSLQEHALSEHQGLTASGLAQGTPAHLPLLSRRREWVRGQALKYNPSDSHCRLGLCPHLPSVANTVPTSQSILRI